MNKQLIGTKITTGSGKYHPLIAGKIGTVTKQTNDYIVVIWENTNGEWHYTHEQFKRFEKIISAPPEDS